MQPDGKGTLTVQDKSKPVTLTGKELDTLASDLESVDLGSLPKNSTSQPPVRTPSATA